MDVAAKQAFEDRGSLCLHPTTALLSGQKWNLVIQLFPHPQASAGIRTLGSRSKSKKNQPDLPQRNGLAGADLSNLCLGRSSEQLQNILQCLS